MLEDSHTPESNEESRRRAVSRLLAPPVYQTNNQRTKTIKRLRSWPVARDNLHQHALTDWIMLDLGSILYAISKTVFVLSLIHI